MDDDWGYPHGDIQMPAGHTFRHPPCPGSFFGGHNGNSSLEDEEGVTGSLSFRPRRGKCVIAMSNYHRVFLWWIRKEKSKEYRPGATEGEPHI